MTDAVFNLDFDILFIIILILSFCLHKNLLQLLTSFRNISFSDNQPLSEITISLHNNISESEIEEST